MNKKYQNLDNIMLNAIKILIVALAVTACGKARFEDVPIDADEIIVVEKEVVKEIIKEKEIVEVPVPQPYPVPQPQPYPVPTPTIKTVSCYSWANNAPLYGPQKASDVVIYGEYTYITEWPSGRSIRICARCFSE